MPLLLAHDHDEIPNLLAEAASAAMVKLILSERGSGSRSPQLKVKFFNTQNLNQKERANASEQIGFQAHYAQSGSLLLHDTLTLIPPSSIWEQLTNLSSLAGIGKAQEGLGFCSLAYAQAVRSTEVFDPGVCDKTSSALNDAFEKVLSKALEKIEMALPFFNAPAPSVEQEKFNLFCELVGNAPSLHQKAALRWTIAGLPQEQRLALMASSPITFHLFGSHREMLADDSHVELPIYDIQRSGGYVVKSTHKTANPLSTAKAILSPTFWLKDAADNKARIVTPDGPVIGAYPSTLWAESLIRELHRFDISGSASASKHEHSKKNLAL